MSKVKCPGSETWSRGLGAEGFGLDPLDAILNGFLKLILKMTQDNEMQDFLLKECDGDCWRRITGPEFERFNGLLELQPNGTWKYMILTVIRFWIDCSKNAGEISNEQLMQTISAELKKRTNKRRDKL